MVCIGEKPVCEKELGKIRGNTEIYILGITAKREIDDGRMGRRWGINVNLIKLIFNTSYEVVFFPSPSKAAMNRSNFHAGLALSMAGLQSGESFVFVCPFRSSTCVLSSYSINFSRSSESSLLPTCITQLSKRFLLAANNAPFQRRVHFLDQSGTCSNALSFSAHLRSLIHTCISRFLHRLKIKLMACTSALFVGITSFTRREKGVHLLPGTRCRLERTERIFFLFKINERKRKERGQESSCVMTPTIDALECPQPTRHQLRRYGQRSDDYFDESGKLKKTPY